MSGAYLSPALFSHLSSASKIVNSLFLLLIVALLTLTISADQRGLSSALLKGSKPEVSGAIVNKPEVEKDAILQRSDKPLSKRCQSNEGTARWFLEVNGSNIAANDLLPDTGISILGDVLKLDPAKMADPPKSATCRLFLKDGSGGVADEATFAVAVLNILEPMKLSPGYDSRDFRAMGRADNTLDVPCAVEKTLTPLHVSWFQQGSEVTWNQSEFGAAYQVLPGGGPGRMLTFSSILVLGFNSTETDYTCKVSVKRKPGEAPDWHLLETINLRLNGTFNPSTTTPILNAAETINTPTENLLRTAELIPSNTSRPASESPTPSAVSNLFSRNSTPESTTPSAGSGVSSGYIAAGVVPLLVILGGFVVWFCRRKFKEDPYWFSKSSVEFSKTSTILPMFKESDYGISWKSITVTGRIGVGFSSNVFKGEWKTDDGVVVVALKTGKGELSENLMSYTTLIREIDIMKRLGRHEHVVELMGHCVDEKKIPYVVLEFAPNGSLLCFLKSLHPNEPVSRSAQRRVLPDPKVFKFGLDIAKGMQFLEKNKVIHRDMAARNVLVFEDESLKVSDFGLSKDVALYDYYTIVASGNEFLPFRWMALETMESEQMKFTFSSDCWSFGIVLWEIVTLGHRRPYPDIHMLELMSYLKRGKRMRRPSACPRPLYEVMKKCWKANPKTRPTFASLVNQLEDLLAESELQTHLSDDSAFPNTSSPSSEASDSVYDPHLEGKDGLKLPPNADSSNNSSEIGDEDEDEDTEEEKSLSEFP